VGGLAEAETVGGRAGGAARRDSADDGRGPGGPQLGGPRSGFVTVERGWRQPPPGEARPEPTAEGGVGAEAARRARGREGSAWDDPDG
jgi:hypothetical protein